jgi:hypothetical protein
MPRRTFVLGAVLALLAGCSAASPGDETATGAASPGADQTGATGATGATASEKPDNWVDANCPLREYVKGDEEAREEMMLERERCIAGDLAGSLLDVNTSQNLAGWSMEEELGLRVDFVLATTTAELLAEVLKDGAGKSPLRVQLDVRQSLGWDGKGDDPRYARREVTVSNVRVGTRFGYGDQTLVPIDDAALPDPDPPSLLWQQEADSWNSPYFGHEEIASNSADTPQGLYALQEFGKLPEVSDYYFDRSAIGAPWVFGGPQALIPAEPEAYWLDRQSRVVTFLLPHDVSEWTLMVFDISSDGSQPREVATWLARDTDVLRTL